MEVCPFLDRWLIPFAGFRLYSAGRPCSMGTQDEMVTIVDEHNNVVGAVPRSTMRAERLTHRATYVMVFNPRGELYVHKRTPIKDVFPGYYDVAAGGVVLEGESYEEGAIRELYEELGIPGVSLRRLFDFSYQDEHIRVWGAAFLCVYDGEMVLQKDEVESGAFLNLEEVLRLTESEPFTPDGVYVLRRYLNDEGKMHY
jgi:isopentenyldiphosphate isomerase